MKKYTHTYSVILDNMDMTEYRLRPIAAIMYIQDAFARFTATKKMAAYDMFPKNIYWVVGEFNVEFVDKLPFWSEEIKTEIWISELSKLKIYTDFNIYSNDKLFAKGNACWFLIDMTTKRPVKTDKFASKPEIYSEFSLGEHKKFLQLEKTDIFSQITHKINLSDLDFNNHVNNKSYINLAEMSIKNELKDEYCIKSLNIRFLKETFFDDVLTCTTYKATQENTFISQIEKDSDSVCEIHTLVEKIQEKEDILNSKLKDKE